MTIKKVPTRLTSVWNVCFEGPGLHRGALSGTTHLVHPAFQLSLLPFQPSPLTAPGCLPRTLKQPDRGPLASPSTDAHRPYPGGTSQPCYVTCDPGRTSGSCWKGSRSLQVIPTQREVEKLLQTSLHRTGHHLWPLDTNQILQMELLHRPPPPNPCTPKILLSLFSRTQE